LCSLFIFWKKKIAQKKTLRWTGDHPQEDLGKFGYRLEKNEILKKNGSGKHGRIF
jgi:hypothetical protein